MESVGFLASGVGSPNGVSKKEVAMVAAVAHYMLDGDHRYEFATYLNPSFANEFDRFQIYTDVTAVVTLLLVLVVAVAAPWVYINFVLVYPCAQHVVQIGNETTSLAQKGCHAINMLRTPVAFLLMPCAMFAQTCVSCIAGALLRIGVVKPYYFVTWLRAQVGNKISKLKYHKIHSFYGVPCGCYESFMLIMLVVFAYVHSGFALVVGKVVGDLLLSVVSKMLAPSDAAIETADLEFRSWTESGDSELWIRLMKHDSTTISLTKDEFNAIAEACQDGGCLAGLLDDVRNFRMLHCRNCGLQLGKRPFHTGVLKAKHVLIHLDRTPECVTLA